MLQYGGSLAPLCEQGLIDTVLGAGVKQGYGYRLMTPPGEDGEFHWAAAAEPRIPRITGHRYFFSNHEGVTYYSDQGPAPLLPSCEPPAGWLPVGR